MAAERFLDISQVPGCKVVYKKEKGCNALRSYESHFGLPAGSATIDNLRNSAAGIEGWTARTSNKDKGAPQQHLQSRLNWREFSNPHQFDKSTLNRESNARMKATEKREREMIKRTIGDFRGLPAPLMSEDVSPGSTARSFSTTSFEGRTFSRSAPLHGNSINRIHTTMPTPLDRAAIHLPGYRGHIPRRNMQSDYVGRGFGTHPLCRTAEGVK